MQKDIMEREIAEIIKGFRQDSIEIEMNQEHVHKWISQFSPDTQNIILEETLHILKECIRQITRLPKKVSPPDRGGES